MPHMTTTIGRGLVPVQVEYTTDVDYDDEGKAHIDIDIEDVYLYCSPKAGLDSFKIDVSGLLTDSVFASLESDCKAHEIAEERAKRTGFTGDDSKLRALAHYTHMAQEVTK